MATIPYKPSWGEHLEGMKSANVDTALKSTDAYQAEKSKELKNSKKARDWEKSKNEFYQKQKPDWAKKRKKAEIEPLNRALRELKVGGKFEKIKPMPGFVLVKPEFKDTTDSGIVVTTDDSFKMNTNTGEVIATGDERVDLYKAVSSPVKEKDKVLFKKGLPGLEVTIDGDYCLLMQWTDILGIVL